jgi:DNA-binding CsgD family transcriptional regulator
LECHYHELHLPTGGDFIGRRRDDLWDGVAAEVFLPPNASYPLNYKEIGIAANGLWTDLDISPGHHDDLRSGFKRSMWVDPKTPVWVAELAIPIKSLTPHFDPKKLCESISPESREPRSRLPTWRGTPQKRPSQTFMFPVSGRCVSPCRRNRSDSSHSCAFLVSSELGTWTKGFQQRARAAVERESFGLTPRELQVIATVAAGSTNMDIAHALSISEDMVKRHLTHIFDKVGVSNRLELGLFAVHHHLVTLDLCGLPPPPTFV